MIRTPLALLLAALLATPAAAAPCALASAQADMARRMQGLQGCLQHAQPAEAAAPADPQAGPRTALVAGCQSNARAEAAGCGATAKAAAKPNAARRAVKRSALRR